MFPVPVDESPYTLSKKGRKGYLPLATSRNDVTRHEASARVSRVATGQWGWDNLRVTRGRASRTDRASGLLAHMRGKAQRDSGYSCKCGKAG